MSKQEYMRQLKERLKRLPKEDFERAVASKPKGLKVSSSASTKEGNLCGENGSSCRLNPSPLCSYAEYSEARKTEWARPQTCHLSTAHKQGKTNPHLSLSLPA